MDTTPKNGLTLEEFAGIMRVNVEVYGEQIEEAIKDGDEQEQHYARGSRDAYAFVLRIITNDQEGHINND